eukprot:365535-Chlamydomonas_euryale.AAC.17
MSVSAAEHTLIGALGGTTEVLLMQPLIGIKNALQEGRPIPANPAHLYRGTVVSRDWMHQRRGGRLYGGTPRRMLVMLWSCCYS